MGRNSLEARAQAMCNGRLYRLFGARNYTYTYLTTGLNARGYQFWPESPESPRETGYGVERRSRRACFCDTDNRKARDSCIAEEMGPYRPAGMKQSVTSVLPDVQNVSSITKNVMSEQETNDISQDSF